MNKPSSVAYEELKQELANLINNSGLPPFVIESVLQNYLDKINQIARNQYQIEKAQYEKSLLDNISTDKNDND